MNKTALALFRNQLQVDEALQDLQAQGVSTSHMKSFSSIGNSRGGYKIATIGTHPDDRYADMKSELFKALRQWGIPRDDAFLFTEGVRHGGKLVIVFTDDGQMDLITSTLKHHGALDLNSRKRFAEEAKKRPSEGISNSPFTKIEQSSTYAHNFAEWLSEHKGEIGPRSAVKVYEIQPPPEDFGFERNLNE